MAAKLIRGMQVVVLSGKDKGKTGKILRVDQHARRVIVEGINIIKRAVRPNQANPSGGFVEREAQLDLSNIAAIDPETKKATRVKFEVVDGKKVRVARKSGKVLDVERAK